MPADWSILLVVAGAAAAGFVQGLSGFAFALTAMSFWAWTLAPVVAGPAVVFCSLVGQAITIAAVRKSFSLSRALPFIVGGVAGVPIGVAILKNIDVAAFKTVVGGVIMLFCGGMLVAGRLPRLTFGGRLADGGAGFVGGIMGGIGGFSGAAPTLWTTLRGWKKDAQRAAFQSFNLVIHAVTLVTYALTGVFTAEAGWLLVLVVPAMVVPALLGMRLYRRIDDAAFRRVVLLLLSVSGAALLVSGISA